MVGQTKSSPWTLLVTHVLKVDTCLGSFQHKTIPRACRAAHHPVTYQYLPPPQGLWPCHGKIKTGICMLLLSQIVQQIPSCNRENQLILKFWIHILGSGWVSLKLKNSCIKIILFQWWVSYENVLPKQAFLHSSLRSAWWSVPSVLACFTGRGPVFGCFSVVDADSPLILFPLLKRQISNT